MKRTSLMLALTSAIFLNAISQKAGTIEPALTENGVKFKIRSEVLGDEREIFVGLPANFNDSSSYPLVMILDAEMLFESIAPLTRLGAMVGEWPECVVVGLPLNNRHLDFAPKISSHPESGNADRMLEFFRDELFPQLEEKYNCSQERIIWGHSAMAGIFCQYILVGPDEQFDGIIASSPNLRFVQEDYLSCDDVFKLTAGKGELYYFLSFGDSEEEAYMGMMYTRVKEFAARLEAEAPGNLRWFYRLNENKNHFSNAIESYMDGLKLYFHPPTEEE